ncbi:MAG: bifunctional glycosyltransferase/CDP-glycerol:glycerophosphate glycerophosphotransferase [Angustibacter sp.]
MPALFSVIIPTYNVARYLPAFLASLEAQTVRRSDVEYLFVDDGSPDDSAEIIQRWIDATGANARVISQDNGGLSSARNRGLAEANGTWVTFCDPDDVLSSNYLSIMAEFVRTKRARKVHLVAGNIQILDDATGELRNDHPLRVKFAAGDQVVNLLRHPQHFHLQAASAFYRLAIIRSLGLQFDSAIKPNFEDAFFTTLYLAAQPTPWVALMASAVYQYRRRDDGSSLVQLSWVKPEKFTVLPRVGYLRLLQSVHQELGHVPQWVQNLVLYDLFFYFRQDARIHSATANLPTEQSEAFHATLVEIAKYLDAESIIGFHVIPTSFEIRMAVLLGAKGEWQAPIELTVNRIDADRQIAQIRYYYAGEPPVEQFKARGYVVRPIHEKRRAVRFLGKTMMYERIVWLPATGTLAVSLDRRPMPIRAGRASDPTYSLRPTPMWRSLARRPAPPLDPPEAAVSSSSRNTPASSRLRHTLRQAGAGALRAARSLRPRLPDRRALTDRLVVRTAWSKYGTKRFGGAWLLMDRDIQAGDNAEHLYRYLMRQQPQVNAYFVISRQSPDWSRLQAEGFRLLDHGSRWHTMALLRAEHLVSSQVDHYVVAPLDRTRFGRTRFRFTFLQHGVTKDDLSRWINGKPISRLITATRDEYESFVGDDTPYTFTTKEVALTGFPRHDRLRERDAATAGQQRLVLIMPTWRRELLGETIGKSNDRHLLDDFWQSEYAQQWMAVLTSDKLREAATQAGWRIAFMPHPNMQRYLDTADLPAHIEVHRYGASDVQDIIARGAVMVTDYSSNAFEAAYLGRAVVYFQFDQDTFWNGGHAYRKGTWSYEHDGFGPVLTEADRVIDAVVSAIADDGVPAAPFAERIEAAFPFRDGECCRRTYESIVRIKTPITYDEAYLRVDRDLTQSS